MDRFFLVSASDIVILREDERRGIHNGWRTYLVIHWFCSRLVQIPRGNAFAVKSCFGFICFTLRPSYKWRGICSKRNLCQLPPGALQFSICSGASKRYVCRVVRSPALQPSFTPVFQQWSLLVAEFYHSGLWRRNLAWVSWLPSGCCFWVPVMRMLNHWC